MKKIIRKWLNWYCEKEAVRLQARYDRYMSKIEKRDNKINQIYEKVDKWLEGKK